jgi:hypothetical protein
VKVSDFLDVCDQEGVPPQLLRLFSKVLGGPHREIPRDVWLTAIDARKDPVKHAALLAEAKRDLAADEARLEAFPPLTRRSDLKTREEHAHLLFRVEEQAGYIELLKGNPELNDWRWTRAKRWERFRDLWERTRKNKASK